VTRCRGVVERHARDVPRARDVVHWDFTPANVLGLDGEVTGVIDWGGTCSGDRLFDLATWHYDAADDVLRDYVVERAGEGTMAVYLAHLAIRQAGWSVRHHSRAVALDAIRYGVELFSAA
jgi:aminoglycoside phosphotransferase (APT) family kinase protein